MKKIKYIFLTLLLFFVTPLCLTLTGCGATPVSEVKAIYFDSDIYDEKTGYAVFELDCDVPTQLPYKINPSGWSGELLFNAVKNGQNKAPYFDLNEASGVFTIMDEASYQITEVQVIIYVSVKGKIVSFEDRCLVKLKKYPIQIFVNEDRDTEAQIYLNAGGAHTLHIYGNFGNGDVRELAESDYNFNVMSSDNSVLIVPNISRLTIKSLKNRIDEVKFTVKLLDAKGNERGENFVLIYNVKVVLPASYSVATFEGYDNFIFDGDTVDITIDNTFDSSLVGNSYYYDLDFDVELFSNNGISNEVYLDKSEYEVICTSNQERYRIIDNENMVFQVRKPQNSNTLQVSVTIATTAINNANNVYKMSFVINFHFSD